MEAGLAPQAAIGGLGSGAEHLPPDCRGMNFYDIDHGLQALLDIYMDQALRDHMQPHFHRLGALAGGRLDQLAATADRNEPVLHSRDRLGRDADWIDYHPAYREMEAIAYGQIGMHAMSHRGGVLDWPEKLPPLVKYAITYLFVQGEFGLMCPISVSDTSNFTFLRYADEALKEKYRDRLLSQDMEAIWKGTQFMTEKGAGSDVGAVETVAQPEAGHWRLYGEKWFCSHADADMALLLARPEGAQPGTRGLGLFAMPRWLDDGSRNSYRIVRLKPKLGTRSMASGEIRMEGALAYAIGDVANGFKQMMDQVNLSRLSHGVRAASMMRRCLNESLLAAQSRRQFGKTLAEMPLLRRQLMKLMVPTEQALSLFAYTAHVMGNADKGDDQAERLLRLLTPIYKFRACRDNITVATGAMEVRGGLGYIEEWVNARLVRDAHVGVLWEGTSNINAIDVVTRAVGKVRAHEALKEDLHARLDSADGVPGQFRTTLGGLLDRACDLAAEIAGRTDQEHRMRQAAGALYHATSAVLMAWEAAEAARRGGDARRLLLSALVARHRLEAQDPLRIGEDEWELTAAGLLLDDAPVSMAEAAKVVAAR